MTIALWEAQAAVRRTCGAALVVLCASAIFVGGARAATLTDGVLSVDVSGDGRVRQIFIDGTAIDSGGFALRQFVNGAGLAGGQVAVNGREATYSAKAGALSVNVTTWIRGRIPGDPNSAVLIQRFLIVNPTATDRVVASVSYSDLDPADADAGITARDAATRSVVTSNPGGAPPRAAFMAADDENGRFDSAFHNAQIGIVDKKFTNLNNATGPVGPADVDSAVGLRTKTSVAPGESVTMTFCHGFTTDFSTGTVPAGFDCARLKAASTRDASKANDDTDLKAQPDTIWNRVRRFFLAID